MVIGLTERVNQRRVFDRIAGNFDAARRRPWPEVLEFIESNEGKGSSLDLGCGNGRHTLLLAEKFARVLATDFSSEMIEIAKVNLKLENLLQRVSLFVSEATRLPIQANSIDIAIYIATLHHIPTADERLNSLLELKRCLKTKARCLVSVWALDQPRFKEVMEGGKSDIHVPWKTGSGKVYQRFYHLFLGKEFRDLIMESGFHLLKFYRSGDNYYAEVVKHD